MNLSALLRGKALEVYSRLSREAAGNYEALKEALLRRFQLTQEGFRQKFRACQPETGESAPQFAIRLDNYLMRWIELSKSEKSFQGLKDLLLREQLTATGFFLPHRFLANSTCLFSAPNFLKPLQHITMEHSE